GEDNTGPRHPSLSASLPSLCTAICLVPNRLVVQLRQYWTVIRCSLPICHARALLKPPSNRCVTFLCLPLRSLYCYLSKSFNFARICNIFSSCQLCELIDIRLACCQECGKDAASPVGELVTM